MEHHDCIKESHCIYTYIQDASSSTPIIVFLSPGVDVAASVEGLGRKVGFTIENGMFSVVSLGQVVLVTQWPSQMCPKDPGLWSTY